MKISYEEKGEGDEVILFIHGLGSRGCDWEKQIEFFSKNYRCITPDLRGHGKSQANESDAFDIVTLASDIISLIEDLKIAPAHLVGISLGGMVAFQIAVDEPNLVKSLTIVNALPAFMPKDLKQKWLFYSRILFVRIFGMKIFAKILARKLFTQKNLQKKLQESLGKISVKIYLKILKSILGWSVVNKLHTIICPSLFIASENDYTSIEEKRFFANKVKIKASLIEIKGAKHAVSAEMPDEFNKALLEFIFDGKTQTSSETSSG
ncbi:MAG: hypothetical protein A2887_03615 [Alphaproteobacteria bacterium RIFCSPLOWO2_01_FULL_40_26]|nr:MAG: hypothetical protein A3D15_04770 [Alphaproteobacteria bacterium RIFCSPHIGHO2_02_FULL_40_34]OFW95287.1 MAG: hypothetical protein A2887_03615 [Alphaproteobacteria bacterium RIFCSPLOWO2_01_FULL_40_26]OFX09190.1 MAG: hypothetical protein A3H30_06320 [Alphaproteobacteria bacterium RIFCSPLOWO2_02_FULL_40_19]OFX11546.1 MAG: hypothetical protein A3G22_04925 [Alphaproteobacteria bacterium RIFCSPLOWO2_12_FULL_40_11]